MNRHRGNRQLRKMLPSLGAIATVVSLTVSACMVFHAKAAGGTEYGEVRVDISEQRAQRIDRPDRARHIKRGSGE